MDPKFPARSPNFSNSQAHNPVDQHQQKNHRQSRPLRRTARIQTVKARDQTGGRHLQRKNGRTFTQAPQPCGLTCVPTKRYCSSFNKIKSGSPSRNRSRTRGWMR